jgi:hypothetical protein
MKRGLILGVVLALAIAPPVAADDDETQSRTILVDEGGSYEVAVHPDFVTVLYLPDKITKAVASDQQSYEVKSLGSTSLAIRPLKENAKPASLAIATETIKVSVVLSIASDRSKALTQVTFKRADVEAEVQRRIDEAVKERTAELEAQVAEMKQDLDAKLPKLAEGVIAERVLARREVRKLKAIERNDDNVIVRVTEALYLGEDVYLIFSIQNRDKSPYRLATVQVLADGRDKAGVIRFTSTAEETAGEGVLGVVAPRSRGTGVVVVRRSADLLGKSLTFEVAQAKGRGKVSVGGVVLK